MTNSEQDGVCAPDLDRMFNGLSNTRRRRALYYLLERDGAVGLSELTTAVVDSERTDDAAEPPEEVVHTIRIELHHMHLPKLAEAGFVDYDRRSQTVRRDVQDEQVRAFLRRTRRLERD